MWTIPICRTQIDEIRQACEYFVTEETRQLGGSPREITVFDPDQQTSDQLQEAARKFLKEPKVRKEVV